MTAVYEFVADEGKKKALITAYEKYPGEQLFDQLDNICCQPGNNVNFMDGDRYNIRY